MSDVVSASRNSPTGKRKRGGQPGNFNALSHGFYSRTMTKLEMGDLDAALGTDLEDTLALMKVLLRRTFDLSDGESDPMVMISHLGAAGLAAMRIVALDKALRLAGREGGASAAIDEALTQVMKEIKLYV